MILLFVKQICPSQGSCWYKKNSRPVVFNIFVFVYVLFFISGKSKHARERCKARSAIQNDGLQGGLFLLASHESPFFRLYSCVLNNFFQSAFCLLME